MSFPWVKSDHLGVYTRGTANEEPKEFTFSGEEGSATGHFIGTLFPSSVSEEYIYTVYPYNATKNFIKSTNVEYTFSLATIQEQRHGADGRLDPRSLAKYAYMHGKSDTKLSMAHASSLMKMSQAMTIFDFEITNIAPWPFSSQGLGYFVLVSEKEGALDVQYFSGKEMTK